MFSLRNKKAVRIRYRLTWKEWLTYGALGAGICAAVLLVFYGSPAVSGIGAVAGWFLYPLLKRGDLKERKKQRVLWEFKENLYALSTALRAGESLESAFASMTRDMDGDIYQILTPVYQSIVAQMKLHRRLEDLLLEFAAETKTDDIRSFAEIIAVAKRTRGDTTQVIENTAQLLQEKIEIRQELEVLLARKKTEQRIMNLMPLLVIGMLATLSPDYVRPLYVTLQGRVIMSVCLLLALASVLIARHMADIAL